MKAFIHTPRAPEVSDGFPDQRWFRGPNKEQRVQITLQKKRPSSQSATVVRLASENKAELGIRFDTGITSGSIDVALTATELRELAQRLLDAAHDIDTNPAPQAEVKNDGETA